MGKTLKDSDVQAHTLLPREPDLAANTIETLLVEKGLVDPAAIDAVVDAFTNRIGPQNGAKVVARAWVDSTYRSWLLNDATAAMASLGFSGIEGEQMVAVENTSEVHNMAVCSLCSCSPWPALGAPPIWYKSPEYRARVVRDPRGVLAEFGVELGSDVEIRVWETNAAIRYFVLPMRPAGTDGLTEPELAALVTREAMMGTGLVRGPGGR